MKTYDIQITYRTPEGELEDPWITVQARSKADAKAKAEQEAVSRSNGKGVRVSQIRLA